MLKPSDYQLRDPNQLITPCLLVYPERIRSNIEAMIRIAGSVERLRPHVKTHKTPQVVQLQQDFGIHKFKCATLCEAKMLGECEAADVLIAYPQIGPAIDLLVQLVEKFPKTRFSTVVDDLQAAQALNEAMLAASQSVGVLVDIDNGMHRTGIPAGDQAVALYRFLCEAQALVPRGLHVYDGQNHQPDRSERETAVANLMQPVRRMVEQLRAEDRTVETLVCGGTPTFPVFANYELDIPGTELECSPGTSIFSDFNYGHDYPDIAGIQPAAILMTRVISKQAGAQTFTLDLGNKAVAADPPAGKRCHFLSLPDAKELKQNEEHLRVESSVADSVAVGDVHYVVPAHICPTVALHRFVQVVEGGELVDCWEVTARDRIYRVH
ncbi:MAG: D-TA family PLP-dependent enzyme [bacterium]|nr:D-TA family PLP-dependent enzyme [bacterium]